MQSTMNPGNLTQRPRTLLAVCRGAFALLAAALAAGAQTVANVAAPLLTPTSIVFDANGVLYVAESGRHVVDRLDAAGGFTVVAGNGTQGFAGDGGVASAAVLDSPRGLAIDGAGNLYIADTRNHRVRVVAAGSGIIRTVAGTGAAGFSGDGGAAIAARLSLPTALAVDSVGNLYLADSGNQRIRRVVLATGVISTVAGSGVQGGAGDQGLAVAAALDTPWGLAVNGAGDLFLADLHNGRVRRVAHDTGVITPVAAGTGLRLPRGLSIDAAGNVYVAETSGHRVVRLGVDGTASVVAGSGVEGFAGDGGAAVAALLDGPQATGLSPAGLVTVADTGNQRVRQVDGAGVIRTIGGVGASGASGLALSGPAAVQYGTGSITATVSGGSAVTGSVSFAEVVNGASTVLGTVGLAGNAASFSTAGLGAGNHAMVASYAGDSTHPGAMSNVFGAVVTPAPVAAHPVGATVLYGQAIPALSGSLSGVLARDVNAVSAVFGSAARVLSAAGSYPIGATLVGAGAGNYQVAVDAAAVTIAQAPTVTTVSTAGSPAGFGAAVTVSAEAASTTSGTPTGRLTFLDGGGALGSVVADAAGGGALTTAALTPGTHSVTAVYSGDMNFLGSTSGAVSQVISPGVGSPDFTLAAAGGGLQTVAGGATASFGLTLAVQNGPLNSPILLAASGVPAGFTASFSPALVPPGGSAANVTLSIKTVKTMAHGGLGRVGWLAGLVMLPLIGWRRRRGVLICLVAVGLCGLGGCGQQVTQLASPSGPGSASYPMVVTATTTLAGGSTLQHTAAVTLIVQ